MSKMVGLQERTVRKLNHELQRLLALSRSLRKNDLFLDPKDSRRIGWLEAELARYWETRKDSKVGASSTTN